MNRFDNSISAEFERTVLQYPERLAVRSKSYDLTYAELNAFANRVARAILKRRGTGQEPVAILLDDDAPKVAAILGVLKAAKIYIPMDPSFPTASLAEVLDDSQASLIVTDRKNLSLCR